MFHVKHSRRPVWSGRRSLLAAAVLGLVGLAAAGCTGQLAEPEGWAAPVLANGLVIVQERPGELVAVNIGDGVARDDRVVWRFPEDAVLPAGTDPDDIDLEAIYATPIVDGADVYVAAYSGDVLALRLDVGADEDQVRVRWLRRLSGHVVGTPAYDRAAGVLYVPTADGELVPVGTANGEVGEPVARADARLWSQPALDGSTIYVGGLDHRVRAIDRATQVERWSERLGGAVAGDPVLDGEMLYVGALDRSIYALDLGADGAERWSFPGDGWFWARPLLRGEMLYAATVNGSVYALDTRRGEELWRFPGADSEIRAQPVLVGGVLVVAARAGSLFGVDPATGDQLWREDLLEGQLLADPLVLESAILYITNKGELIEVDPLSGATTTVFARG